MGTTAAKAAVRSGVLRLYDATDELLAVEVLIDEQQEAIIAAGGDLSAVPGLLEALEAVELQFDVKVERVALFILDREAMAEARRLEAKRLTGLARGDENTATGLRSYLVREMRRANRPKVEQVRAKVRVQANPMPVLQDVPPGAEELRAGVTQQDRLRAALQWAAGINATGPFAELAAGVGRFVSEVSVVRTEMVLDQKALAAWWKEEVVRCRAEVLKHDQADRAAGGVFAPLTEATIHAEAESLANGHPLMVRLGLRFAQGFHVRIQ